jgi:hypothetical protein
VENFSTPCWSVYIARLELALEIDLGALLEILLGDLAEVLVEDHHAMPFGALAPFAGGLVAPVLRRCQPQVDHRPPVLGVANLRIGAEIADQDHFVDRPCHFALPCCREA